MTNSMLQKKNKKGVKYHSFTLIELLIVIGLLGALTALILPTLSANREEALGDVCDYNQAGSVRTLKQYESIVGGYPSDLHNGLQGTDGSAEAMPGLPAAQAGHMGDASETCPSLHQLSSDQADSLEAAGITSITYDDELNSEEVAADVAVVIANNGDGAWEDDSDPAVEMTFDGVDVSEWADGSGGPSWNDGKAGEVVVLWIAPTVDWSAGDGGNNDWSKGNVELGIDMEGQCPIPTASTEGDDGEVSFSYYMAYFKVFDDGSPARMIGSTCPECGVLNP